MLILPPSAAGDRKLFQCVNIVSDNKTGPIERGQCDVTLPWWQNFWITTIGSLSNDDGDGDGKENSKQNNRFRAVFI